MVTYALIIDNEIAAFASSERHDAIPRHSDHFYVFSLRHAKNLEYQVRNVFGPIDLEDFVLLPVQVDLVGILGIAKFAGANLVDSSQRLLLVVVEATPTEPLLQALQVDVAAASDAVAGRK